MGHSRRQCWLVGCGDGRSGPCELRSCVGGLGGDEVGLFGEVIDDDKDGVVALAWWQLDDVVE